MANNNNDYIECEEEIAALADDLVLRVRLLISEDEAAAVPARRIVFGEEVYYIHVYWSLTGRLARHFCGQWRVKVDLESIGTAQEYTSPMQVFDMDPCREEEYHAIFAIGPGDLDPHPGGTVYLPAATLSTLDPCGDDGHMWAYCEAPSVMFTPAEPHD